MDLDFSQWTLLTSEEHPGLEIVVGPGAAESGSSLTHGTQDTNTGFSDIGEGADELQTGEGGGIDLAEFTFLVTLDLRGTPVFVGHRTVEATGGE